MVTPQVTPGYWDVIENPNAGGLSGIGLTRISKDNENGEKYWTYA